MKYVVWICTDKNGSRCSCEIDVDDEDIEGMTPEQRDDFVGEHYGKTAIWNMAEWGCHPKEQE